MDMIDKLKEKAREEIGYELTITDQKIRYLSVLDSLESRAKTFAERTGYVDRIVSLCDNIEHDLGITAEAPKDGEESPYRTL